MEPAREAFDDLEPNSRLFSAVGVLPTKLPKSKAPLGVFGVFEAPKEANAPDPKPNALDAPVGDAMEVGDIAPKGFLLL